MTRSHLGERIDRARRASARPNNSSPRLQQSWIPPYRGTHATGPPRLCWTHRGLRRALARRALGRRWRGSRPVLGVLGGHALVLALLDSEKAKLEQAAERDHLQLATWLRQVALKAADHVLAGSTSPGTTRTDRKST